MLNIFSDFMSIFETFFRSGKFLKIDALYDPWVLYKVFHSITCTCTPPFRELLRVPSGMDFDFRHYPDLGSTSDWWRQIFNQSEEYYPDLGSDTSSVWNFCSRFSDVISTGNQWWRHLRVEMSRHLMRVSWQKGSTYAWQKLMCNDAKVRWWLILTLYWWDLFVLGSK